MRRWRRTICWKSRACGTPAATERWCVLCLAFALVFVLLKLTLPQEDAAAVQAFVLKEFGGSWSVDESVDTSAWWGYELPDRTVVHPKADAGVGKPTLDFSAICTSSKRSLEIQKRFGESEGAAQTEHYSHFWVKKQKVFSPSGSEWKSSLEWIKHLQDGQFLVVCVPDRRVGGAESDSPSTSQPSAYLATVAHAEKYLAAVAEAEARTPAAGLFEGGLMIECVRNPRDRTAA